MIIELLRLSCAVQGSGPGLLLAHGGGGSAQSNFGALLAPLASRFTVIAPDYPGSGDSPHAENPLQLDELADQLVLAAHAAGVERFAVLGFSLGCAVAIRIATRHPRLVAALVLTSGFAQLDAASLVRAQALHALAMSKDWETLSRFLVGSLVDERFLGNLSMEQREAFVKNARAAIPPLFAEQMDLVMRVDVRGDLPSVLAPALAIHAARERLVSPRIGKMLSDCIPGAAEASLDCGHFPAGQSHEWLCLTQGFLTRKNQRTVATQGGSSGRQGNL